MVYSRISARRGGQVDLKALFLNGGQKVDPFAIYRIEIYRRCVAAENVVDIVQVDSVSATDYPSPLIHGTEPGAYSLLWNVPADAVVPDIYFDVWYFWGTDPRPAATDELPLSDFTANLLSIQNRFWVYPDGYAIDSGLENINLGFEPISKKFYKPEVKPIEVGIMPLPLYDFDFNLVAPMIPYLTAQITIKTENDEPIVVAAPMEIKLRQGSYRTNPFILSYLLDSSSFFIGTYKYRVSLTLPNGEVRVSQDFLFGVA